MQLYVRMATACHQSVTSDIVTLASETVKHNSWLGTQDAVTLFFPLFADRKTCGKCRRYCLQAKRRNRNNIIQGKWMNVNYYSLLFSQVG